MSKKKFKKLSDITIDAHDATIALEEDTGDAITANTSPLVHLSGVTPKRTWRMRIAEAWLIRAFIVRSFRGLIYGRVQPLDTTRKNAPTSDGYAAPLRNSLVYWTTRPAINFAAAMLLLVLGINMVVALQNGSELGATVLASTRTGIHSLVSARDHISAFRLAEASEEFEAARSSFAQAQEQLSEISQTVSLLHDSPLTTGTLLVRAGEYIARAGTHFTEAVRIAESSLDFEQAAAAFEEGYQDLAHADDIFQDVDLAVIPDDYYDTIQNAQQLLHAIRLQVETVAQHIPAARKALGYMHPMHYLIVFQNTAEKRGTGGFMGSFAIASFENGALVSLIPEDVYRIDWCYDEKLTLPEAPAGLREYITAFRLRDANYSPDFPTSAQWIIWFYENTCAQTTVGKLDGVVAIDDTLLGDALTLTGPVELPAYGVTLTAENYFDILQFFIETNKEQSRIVDDQGRYGTPKQILMDLVPLMRERMKTITDNKALIETMLRRVKEAHMQAYFVDPTLQIAAEHFQVSGESIVPFGKLDYLSVNHMNIGGNKSDRYIREEISHNAHIRDDGTVTDTVTIARTHTMTPDVLAAIQQRLGVLWTSASPEDQAHVAYILGNSPNRAFTRVFVPRGSTLQSSDGIALDDVTAAEEAGKTVFTFTSLIEPGASQSITLTYLLPFVLDVDGVDAYRRLVQKQAGSDGIALKTRVTLDPEVRIVSRGTGETIPPDAADSTTLDENQYGMYILERAP